MTEAEALALAERAVAHWGGAAQVPRLVNIRENAVFDVGLSRGARVALRLHRPGYQSMASISAELDWSGQLAAHGVAVPAPVLTQDGRLCAEADGRLVSCVSWLDGQPIGSAAQPLAGSLAERTQLHQDLGRLLGDLHRATDALNLPAGMARQSWDAGALCGEEPLWGRYWQNPALSAVESSLLLAARDKARQLLTEFRENGADYGLIHADALRENVLCTPDGLALIDFDDAGYGFRLYDLGTALVQSLEDPDLPFYATALVEGYRRARALSDADAGLLPLFAALRAFASAGWIISRAGARDPRQRLYADRAVRMARHMLAGTLPWQA